MIEIRSYYSLSDEQLLWHWLVWDDQYNIHGTAHKEGVAQVMIEGKETFDTAVGAIEDLRRVYTDLMSAQDWETFIKHYETV